MENSDGRSREGDVKLGEGGREGREEGGGKKQQWRVNVSVFVLSRRRARLNTSPVEWMSVSMSRLEAGRPSCDSMWLPAVGFSHLLLYLQ